MRPHLRFVEVHSENHDAEGFALEQEAGFVARLDHREFMAVEDAHHPVLVLHRDQDLRLRSEAHRHCESCARRAVPFSSQARRLLLFLG